MSLLFKKMRDLRDRKGYSLRRLAAESKVSLGYICDIENGKANPSVAIIEKLATALGVPVATLFDIQNEPNNHDTTPCPGKSVETGTVEQDRV